MSKYEEKNNIKDLNLERNNMKIIFIRGDSFEKKIIDY